MYRDLEGNSDEFSNKNDKWVCSMRSKSTTRKMLSENLKMIKRTDPALKYFIPFDKGQSDPAASLFCCCTRILESASWFLRVLYDDLASYYSITYLFFLLLNFLALSLKYLQFVGWGI